jgi:hypothetical protein
MTASTGLDIDRYEKLQHVHPCRAGGRTALTARSLLIAPCGSSGVPDTNKSISGFWRMKTATGFDSVSTKEMARHD